MRAKRNLIPIFAAVLLSGCVGDKAEDIHSVWPRPDARDQEQTVYYVTDREPGGPWGGFSKHWGGKLSCGTVVAVVPPLGQPNEPTGHIKDKSLAPQACGNGMADFAAALAAEAHRRDCHDVLIYIHGFNTLFDGAVLRGAQLGLDTKWACPVAVFSWASEGEVGRYVADIEHSAYAVPELEEFLRALDRQWLHADIVGHSIGARLALSTLASTSTHDDKLSQDFARTLILAAADIGADQENNDFAHLMRMAAPFVQHTTVYASRGDAVLAVSSVAHGDVPRAGRRPKGDRAIETPPGTARNIDIVDCTDAPAELLGHSYFGLSYEAVSDIALALRDVPAERRQTLTVKPDPGPPHYVLAVAPGRRPDFWVRLIRELAPLVPRIELAPLTGPPE